MPDLNDPLSDEQLGDLSDDDLRDRVDEWADEWASSGDIGYALTGRDLIYEVAKRWRAEVERLRAALAARPRPDAEAEVRAFRGLVHDTADTLERFAGDDLAPAAELRGAMREAAAILRGSTGAVTGSATPTKENDDE